MSNLFVISAPSGTGKTSLIRSLLKDNSSTGLTLGISYTTRKMRKNEEILKSYVTSKEDFRDMIKKNQFLSKIKSLETSTALQKNGFMNS